MNVADFILSRRRLFLTIGMLLTLAGMLSWATMPRQEDPRMPYRAALVIVPFPGADAEAVERLVVEPLEQELSQVTEIKALTSVARAGVAVTTIELVDAVSDVDPIWEDVEARIDDARVEFPDSVLEPRFDPDIFDQESIVVSITGSEDPLALRAAALTLEDRLLQGYGVSRIILTADPGEEVRVELEPAALERYGLEARMIAAQLSARNPALPGGTVEAGGRTLTLQPHAEFASVEEVESTPIQLPNGTLLELRDIAEIRLGARDPVESVMRFDGEPAVAVGVVPSPGINLLTFGEDVSGIIAEVGAEFPTLDFDFVAYQPDRVEARLTSLGRSLLQGVLIVALMVILAMGVRLGMTVASIVPLVTLSSLAIYAMAGGVLHQMSIAALVLALGLLVDNAIVVAENIQHRIDEGAKRTDAAIATIRELAVPLGTATGTTLAAFVPMLLSQGATGDFTRAIPIVIMLTLTVSYFFAMTVTPGLSALLLRPKPPGSEASSHMVRAIARAGARHPVWVLLGAALLMLGSVQLASSIRMQFFPASDRNQLVIDVELPEGSHLSETDEVVHELEAFLAEQSGVDSVASFIGRGVPHFYYNLVQKPQRPHFAQVLVTTDEFSDVAPLQDAVREFGATELDHVTLVARRIEQGPPVEAPIELRVRGEDLDDLRQVSDELVSILRQTEGAIDVQHTLGQGAPSLDVRIHDGAALMSGVSREDVAIALFARTNGIEAGQYRSGDEPMPIIVRTGAGEETPIDELTTLPVGPPGAPLTPLDQVAELSASFSPAAITHYNYLRTVQVTAQLQGDITYSEVLDGARERIDAIELPDGVSIEIGGEAEGSGEANMALLTTLPMGVILLLMFLMGEFNSFRKVGIILTTVPLAAVGVIPGLVLGNQPFGFMSMLGAIALIGIVVNNAIVLVDVVSHAQTKGMNVPRAIEEGVRLRIRPILLTTATTVAGLMPLALSESTFWPPLASAMISGLLASTMLTLFVVPALYRLLFRDPKHDRSPSGEGVSAPVTDATTRSVDGSLSPDASDELSRDQLSTAIESLAPELRLDSTSSSELDDLGNDTESDENTGSRRDS